MKNQVFALYVLLGFSSVANAVNPAALLNGTSNSSKLDDLKHAQQVYQNLIREQARENDNANRLEKRLQRAEVKLEKAQFKVNKLRAELMLTRDIQQSQSAELKRAGESLNKAWQAAYGEPSYRVAEKK